MEEILQKNIMRLYAENEKLRESNFKLREALNEANASLANLMNPTPKTHSWGPDIDSRSSYVYGNNP